MPNATHSLEPAATILCVSDVHLGEALPITTKYFLAFLAQRASSAKQLYLLGDLFEYWAGDDDMAAPYHQQIIQALREVRERGCNIFWIAGNRDFLVGDAFANAAGLTLLPDPCLIQVGTERITLTHGDAQCTDDVSYIAFRQTVRQPAWIEQFLKMPLAQRKTIIAGVRKESVQEQKSKAMEIMDVNLHAIEDLFVSSGSKVLIHGHTHRPGVHHSANGIRYVLPDWQCDHDQPALRGGWLSIDDKAQIQAHGLNELEI
jgi:UDP-2,3-diacylglucosamine hydrolase